MLYRYFVIEQVVLKQVIEQNSSISAIYKRDIWNVNSSAVRNINNLDIDDLFVDKEIIKLAKDSFKFFSMAGADVAVYAKGGEKIMANNDAHEKRIVNDKSQSLYYQFLTKIDRYFLKNYISDQPLANAYRGKTQHNLISRAIEVDYDNNVNEISYISSYIPIIDSHDGSFDIVGVIEITRDITEQWESISFLEQRIFMSFLAVFLVFFSIVTYNTSYAQKVINKQFETNKDLAEAKHRAEIESSAKTEFLANISHELRTPLNAIIGFSELILSETYGKMENLQYKDYVQDINNSGKHLLGVINDILDFSKASADKLKVEKIEIDLNKVASSSMRFVKPRADEAGVHLIEKLPKEHIIILADPKRLKQALLNLLSNSVKFTPTDGSVTLSVKKDPVKKKVYISVIDTGIGMSDQDIPKALATFGQVDNKLSRKYEGTGLGLPLTKKLIELMEGKFDIKSKEKKGTKVTITFKYVETIDM